MKNIVVIRRMFEVNEKYKSDEKIIVSIGVKRQSSIFRMH